MSAIGMSAIASLFVIAWGLLCFALGWLGATLCACSVIARTSRAPSKGEP